MSGDALRMFVLVGFLTMQPIASGVFVYNVMRIRGGHAQTWRQWGWEMFVYVAYLVLLALQYQVNT